MDREKTALGIREMLMRDTWRDIDANRPRYQHILNDALALLKEQEALVRCKDCKHKEESVSPSWEAWCNRLHCGCDLNWYCADGERK
jgi:hypothetical protein